MKYDRWDALSITAAVAVTLAGIFIIWVGIQVMPTFGPRVAIVNFAFGGLNFVMAGLNVWILKEKHKEDKK